MAAESKNIEKQHNGDGDDWPRGLIKRKPRIKWTKGLHQYFVKAVAQLGGPYEATPKQIVKLMGIQEINSNHIKSHLQKYRQTRDHIQRIETEAAMKAPAVMPLEANEVIYRGNAFGLHTNDDIQIIKARKATFEGRRRFHAENKNSDCNVQQQVQCPEGEKSTQILGGASKTSENQLCDQAKAYESAIDLLGSVATGVRCADTQLLEAYDILRIGEIKKNHTFHSFVRDSYMNGTEAPQKMHDGLRIGIDHVKGKNISSSIFQDGEPNTRTEDQNDVSQFETHKQSDHPQTSKERNFASSNEPFDLNVSADEDGISD